MAQMKDPLQISAVTNPDAIAVVNGAELISYQALNQSVDRCAASLLRQGIKQTEHIGYLGTNSLEAITLLFACIRIGALFCPLSTRFPQTQISELLDQLDIVALYESKPGRFDVPSIQRWSKETEEFQPKPLESGQPSTLILTSGSSGFPKAAVHSLGNHIASAQGSADQIPLKPGDAWLASLPFFHIGGIAIVIRCLLAGATVVLPSHKSLIDNLASHPITHLSLVNAQLQQLLQEPQGCRYVARLHCLLLGGGAITESLQSQLNQLNVPAFCSYGLTEMASQVTTGRVNTQGVCGHLLANRELRINEGIIEVRGATCFLGYYQQGTINQPFDQDGWFNTKDIGQWVNGQLKVSGRSDNMFISGGENVQPEEIEAALKQHANVSDAVVIAIDDPKFSKLPVAIIKTVTNDFDQDELTDFICQRIARFKRPRHYFSWSETIENELKISRKRALEYVMSQMGHSEDR
ncbi:o-succinylbenzoate--CoA ligase [Ferrimonas aestuarii]|uniref:O-succinylbenzoate--CoA ligase n=1 Tax=Ferrimonas aestuarii TaxID=2569539 RepID=A0A4U1BM25_9GAMM|nr:o-succinylbenzoate--CoA ligase [Ferrimonas aestuarii]TKB51738.1 o-succinylbenzoate--CoA ligase [Ferrimonas aestuarii]